MSDRREALRAKFQADATARIQRLTNALIDIRDGRDAVEQGKRVARELHALKGESNMFGLGRLGRVFHAMGAALGAPGEPREACAAVLRGLDLVSLALQGRLPDEEATLEALLLELMPLFPGLVRKLEAPASRAAPAPATLTAARRHRVLVVDDAPAVRELLAEMIGALHVDVDTADDGRSALARIDASAPDLIVTDRDMPEMNGLELVRALRARLVRIPILMLSARSAEEDRRQALEAGADAYFTKAPTAGETLVDAVRGFLDRAP